MMPAAILTIPSATHRTTPGSAAAEAVAVEAARPARRTENRPRRQVFPRRAPRSPALGARQARPHDGSDEGVGLWIDHGTLAALQRERMAGEGWSEVILRACSPPTGEPRA
jgi:hypothetical protein